MNATMILLPTYNERGNIAYIVPAILTAHPELRILVIDDNSPDGTAEEVRSLMQRYPNVSLLLREKKQGLGEAYKAGFAQALADSTIKNIITMDADGSHGVEYLKDLYSASRVSALVIGSRYVKGGGVENWERWRYALSQWGNVYARTITGLPIHDLTAGFMCFHSDVLRKIDFSCFKASGYAFLMELKFRIIRTLQESATEVPIIFRARREGESKISHHIIREGLAIPWRLRFKIN